MRKVIGYIYSAGMIGTLLVSLITDYDDHILIPQIIIFSLYPFIRENFGFKGNRIKYYRLAQIIFLIISISSLMLEIKYGYLFFLLILLNNGICYFHFLTWGEFRNEQQKL